MARAAIALLTYLVAAAVAFADPPKLVVPADLKPVNGYVRFTPDTTAKSVVYVSLDDAYPFPSEELKDQRRFILPAVGLKAGTYRFVAVGTLNDEQAVAAFSVTIGTPPVVPPPVDPVKPPPAGAKHFFFVLRPPGPIPPATEKLLTLPAWKELADAGHLMADDVALPPGVSLPQLPPGASPPPLPYVLKFHYASDGKRLASGTADAVLPLPATDDAVRALVK